MKLLSGLFSFLCVFFWAQVTQAQTIKDCYRQYDEFMNECKTQKEALSYQIAASGGAAALGAEGMNIPISKLTATNESLASFHTTAAKVCQQRATECETHCRSIGDQLFSKGDTAGATEAQRFANQHCSTLAVIADQDTLSGFLNSVDGLQNSNAALAASGGVEAAPKGGTVGAGIGEFLKNNSTTLMWGAGAVAVGMCIMGSLCEDDSGDGSGINPNSPAAKAQALACTREENYDLVKCESHFVTVCSNNPNDTGCKNFNAHYCGMGDPPDAKIVDSQTSHAKKEEKVTANAGISSSFCQFQVTVDYCEDVSNAGCMSCQQLQMSYSPVCKNNPAACLPGFTSEQIQVAKKQCPTDPYFRNPSFANIEGNESQEAVDASKTTDSEDAQGNGDGQEPSSEATSLAELTGDLQNVGGTQGLAAAGIDSPLSANLFSKSSYRYQKRCYDGKIDNCGPRSGLGGAK